MRNRDLGITLSPLARLIARKGLSTRKTRRIFIAPNVLLFFVSGPDAAAKLNIDAHTKKSSIIHIRNIDTIR